MELEWKFFLYLSMLFTILQFDFKLVDLLVLETFVVSNALIFIPTHQTIEITPLNMLQSLSDHLREWVDLSLAYCNRGCCCR